MDPSWTEDSTSQGSDDLLVLVRINIPELGVQKCMQFHREELVWDVKQQVLAALPKELKESFNYGLYCPPLNGKAGKFLDEERPLLDYPFTGPIGYLELKYKRRVYKNVNVDEKQIKQLHNKANLKRLMEHIVNSQAEKITKLVNKGLDPNFHCLETGETPLTVAAVQKKCQKTILALANGGALLDYRTRDGVTALHRAVEKNNLEAIRTLLDLGASPNYKDNKGLTPLYYSIINNADAHVCELLLHDHAAIGAADHQGWQEVHQVCRNGMVQHLEHLLFYGADMNARNASGNTPLHVCAVNEQESCARVLLFRGADKESLNYANQTPYQVAVIAGDLALAEVIQNHKPEDVVPFREAPKYNPRRRASIVSTTYNLSRTHSDPSLSDTSAPPANSHAQQQQQQHVDTTNEDTSDSLGLSTDGFVTSPSAADQNNTCTSGGYDTFPDRPAPLQMPLSPGLTCVCLENYQPNEDGHLRLVQGDIIEVTGSTDCGLLEGILRGQKGLFPATCVQEVKLRHPENRSVNRRQSIRDSSSQPILQHAIIMTISSNDISRQSAAECRTVVLRKSKKGFGFVLRGAKATSPLMETLPLENWPALQYLDEVDKGGVADLAGLQKGDFLLGINGEDVSQTSHENVVNLIRKSGETVSMTVMTAAAAMLHASSTTPETPTERIREGGPDSPGLGQVGTPRQCATLPRKLSRGKPAPAPPRRDPRTTLSVGRARARSMVAGLAEIEALDRTLVEYDSEGRSTKSSSIESLPNKQLVTEHTQQQSNKQNASQQHMNSKAVSSSFCISQQQQQPCEQIGSPKVYHSVSQMKRSKIKNCNKEVICLHKTFHSNPELANAIIGIIPHDRSPASHRRSHSQEDMTALRKQHLFDDFSHKGEYNVQEESSAGGVSCLENGHPPPPTHPPPPPPVGQVVKVDVSRSRSDSTPLNIQQTSSTGHYQTSLASVMSSFRPGDSAKLYASPQEIGIIGYRQLPSQLPPPTTTAPPPPCSSTNVPQVHHKPVSTTAIRSHSLPVNVQPPPKTSSPSSSASSESETSGDSGGGGYACTTFKQPNVAANATRHHQPQHPIVVTHEIEQSGSNKEYAQPHSVSQNQQHRMDESNLDPELDLDQPYIPEPDYDLSDGDDNEADDETPPAPPIQPPPPPISGVGENKKKPPTPPAKRKDNANRGSGATTIIMIGGNVSDQPDNYNMKSNKVSPPPPAKPSAKNQQAQQTHKAPPPVIAKTVRGPPATVTPIKNDPETADLKQIIAQKAAARQHRTNGSESFVTLSTNFTEEEPVSVMTKNPLPLQPDPTSSSDPDILVNAKELISVFEKKTCAGEVNTVTSTSRTSPLAIRRTSDDNNNKKSLKGSHSQVFEGQSVNSGAERQLPSVKMSKSFPQKLNDEQHLDKSAGKMESNDVIISQNNLTGQIKGPPSPPKPHQQRTQPKPSHELSTKSKESAFSGKSDESDESDDDGDARSLKAKISSSDHVDVNECSMASRRILNRNAVVSLVKFPPPIETGETDVESDAAEATPTELKKTFVNDDYTVPTSAPQIQPVKTHNAPPEVPQEVVKISAARSQPNPPGQSFNMGFVPPPPGFVTNIERKHQQQQQQPSQPQPKRPKASSLTNDEHMTQGDIQCQKMAQSKQDGPPPPPAAPVEIGAIAPPPEFSDDIHIPIDVILDEDSAEEEARNAAAALAAAAGGLHLTCPSFVERTTVTTSSISSSLAGRVPNTSRTKGYTMPHGQINPLTLLHPHHLHHPSSMTQQHQLHHLHPQHHQYLLQQQHHLHQQQLMNLGIGSSATLGRVPSNTIPPSSSSIAARPGGLSSSRTPISTSSKSARMTNLSMPSQPPPPPSQFQQQSQVGSCNGVMAASRDEVYDLPYHYQQQLQLRQQQQQQQQLMQMSKVKLNGAPTVPAVSPMASAHQMPSAGPFKDFHSKPMVQWSVKDVSDWLESLFLPEYKARFEAAGIDGRTLGYLDNNSLVELGVKKVGHRINMERSMRRHAMMK